MSEDMRSRRPAHADGRAEPDLSSAGVGAASLMSLLGHAPRLIDVLPLLHQRALDATGGSCSLLFEQNPRSGSLQATSGFGIDTLGADPWIPGGLEAAFVSEAFLRKAPTLVTDVPLQTP